MFEFEIRGSSPNRELYCISIDGKTVEFKLAEEFGNSFTVDESLNWLNHANDSYQDGTGLITDQMVADANHYIRNTMSLCDDFSWHELLDRVGVMSKTFDSTIINHPATAENKQIEKKASEIADLLGELYQLVGNEAFKNA